jgi:hypothetical protein
MDNLRTLSIIILMCLFVLMRFSILLNLITLAIVGGFIYLSFKVYTRRNDREVTVDDVARDLMTDPLVVGRAYFSEPETGPIGDFTGTSSWSDDDGLKTLTEEVA